MGSESDSKTGAHVNGLKAPKSFPAGEQQAHGTSAPGEGDPAPSGRLAARLQTYRSIATSLFATTGIVALSITFLLGLSTNSVLIEPIPVPPELEEQGYTPEVIAQHLFDHVYNIQTVSLTKTAREGSNLLQSWQQPDFEIPSGVSLQSLYGYVRSLLNLHERRISGEIVRTTDGYRLYLRDNIVGRFEELAPAVTTARLERVLQDGARHLLRKVDPYTLAVYLRAQKETSQAVDIVSYCVRNGPVSDDAWAYNLWGLILKDQKQHELALEKYERAVALQPDFRPAYLNMGLALQKLPRIDLRRIDQHYENATKIFAADPEIYHQWGLSLAWMGLYDRAREKFDKAALWAALTGNRSAVIHLDYGAMLLKHGEALTESAEGEIGNFIGPWDPARLFEAAIDQFEDALEMDPRNAVAHYNLGFALLHPRGHHEWRERRLEYEKAVKTFSIAGDLENEYRERVERQLSFIKEVMIRMDGETNGQDD